MSQVNLSISNFEPPRGTDRGRGFSAEAKLIAWIALFLALIDLVVGFGLKLPWVPVEVRSFFEYGRSIRSKMQMVIGPTDETTHPFARSGWLDPPPDPGYLRAPTSDDEPVVTFYGMSFTENLARTMLRVDPTIKIRSLSGANAPPNHTYALYRVDPARRRSKVAILGVLGTNVPGVLTRGLTWAFDSPPPYTYPIFRQRNGTLESDWPDVRSIQQFRECLYDDAKWAQFTAQMAPSDPFFDPFLFRSYAADVSVTFRLLRKAWGQYRKQHVINQIHTKAGFVPGCQALQDVRGILERFADDARSEGTLPIVVLLDTLGCTGHLETALGPFLRSEQIPYLATGALFPSSDGRSYVPDGHYTPANDEKIVRTLLDMIHRSLDEKQKPPDA